MGLKINPCKVDDLETISSQKYGRVRWTDKRKFFRSLYEDTYGFSIHELYRDFLPEEQRIKAKAKHIDKNPVEDSLWI